MNQFVIDFIYNGAPYSGLVTPKEENNSTYYSVHLESENQEVHLDIEARPCDADQMDWCFRCPDGQEPPKNYDKAFLQEIGEAIEKCEA
ncbi:MAG TPA: hypothetical protein VGM24_06280 [Puia sp.]